MILSVALKLCIILLVFALLRHTAATSAIPTSTREEGKPVTDPLKMMTPVPSSKRPLYLNRLSFPAQEFFRVTDDETLLFSPSHGLFYFENFLGQRTCSVRQHNCEKNCRCDDRCMQDRECCIDYLWNKLNISGLNMDEYLKLLVEKSHYYKLEECRPVLHYTPGHDAEKIYMIASCPKNASESEQNLCISTGASIDINYPVIGSDGYVYKNQHCATCNRISTYKNLNISVSCEQGGNMTDPGKSFSNFDGCLFDVVRLPGSQHTKLKSCTNTLNYECDISNPYFDLCRSYLGLVGGYANAHCLWCNNVQFRILESFQCDTTDGSILPPIRSYSFTISFSTGTNLEFSNRSPFSIDENGNDISQIGESRLCSAGQTYDIFQAKCVAFQCAVGYEIHESTCIKKQNTGIESVIETNSSFDKCLLHSRVTLLFDTGNRSINEMLLHNLTHKIRGFLEANSSYSVDLRRIKDFPHLLAGSLLLSSSNFKYYLSNISSIESPIWKNVDVLYILSQSIDSFTLMYGLDPSRHYDSGICISRHQISYDSVNFTSTCSVKALNFTTSSDSKSQWIEVRPGSIVKNLFVCTKFHLQSACKLKTIVPTNYSYENTSAFIRLKDGTNRTLKDSDYLPLPDGIGVCIESGSDESGVYLPTWLKHTYEAEYYITMIGLPISMICYLWIILTYTLIRELRNTPGCNISALCASLLLSDIVFLIVIEVQTSGTICKVLAIMLHWLLLHVQAWSAIIAIEVARRFGSRVHKSRNTLNRFYMYVLLAMACSSSVVIIMVSIDETEGKVGYGKGGVCWIKDFRSKLFGYILLVGFVTLFTTVLLGYVLLTIYKEHKESSKLLQKSGSEPISITKIALKLVLLVGIIEIIGFVQITSPKSESQHAVNAVFRIVYTLLRSFRGVLIWFMYIPTKVVMRHYRSTLKEITTHTSQSTQVPHLLDYNNADESKNVLTASTGGPAEEQTSF